MQKLYYSISEISEMIDEEQHILRYWEKEFDQLKPKKNRGGNRIYSEKDLFIIKTIKKLIRQDKLSLKGAKEQLASIVERMQETQEPLPINPPISNELQNDPADRQPAVRTVPKVYLNDLHKLLREVRDFLK